MSLLPDGSAGWFETTFLDIFFCHAQSEWRLLSLFASTLCIFYSRRNFKAYGSSVRTPLFQPELVTKICMKMGNQVRELSKQVRSHAGSEPDLDVNQSTLIHWSIRFKQADNHYNHKTSRPCHVRSAEMNVVKHIVYCNLGT